MRFPSPSVAFAARRGPRAARAQRTAPALLAAAVALGALAVATGLVEAPDAGGAVEGLADSLGAWTYVVVPLLAFLETGAFVGLLVPGETAVLVGGAVAERGEAALVPLVGLVWAAAFLGDLASFLVGRRFGRAFLDRHGRRVGISAKQVARVERFFLRHGPAAIVLGRFIGVLRAFVPFVAGTSGLALARFLPYSAAGTLAWATTLTLVGALFADAFAAAGSTVTTALVALAAVAALVVLARRALRRTPR